MALRLSTKHPPATYELRPEKEERRPGLFEPVATAVLGLLLPPLRTRLAPYRRLVADVDALAPLLAGKSTPALAAEIEEVGLLLRRHGFRHELVARSFAAIREVADRVLGMRHYPCQIIGGGVLLRGRVAEMHTGEGKTLTATLAAGTAALAGLPVHVITVNDYLTARDAEQMRPVYEALGLSVGCITHDCDLRRRQQGYGCDITYCTNKDLVFDYLRDRLTLGDRSAALLLQAEYLFGRQQRVRNLLLRGLHFAIVDEADSVLIDEARTPLIISKKVDGHGERAFLEQAMELAGKLQPDIDYRLLHEEKGVELTAAGSVRIADLTRDFGPLWSGEVRRLEMARQALSALHFFHKDEQYLLADGKVQIIDEYTGRLMPDRSWERGLHQLIEIKEGSEISSRQETLAKISYQRFFRKYLHLSGMTGTAWEVRSEFWAVYRLSVVKVPSNRPLQRLDLGEALYPDQEQKWQAVVNRIDRVHALGRPVLVGTRSVAASELLSELLRQRGMAHYVLNARFDKQEAEIIAKAGRQGSITIATNMAGRGTDIKLAPEVVAAKGLHVILTERHDAARIDRQLIGRCGRQGDPGSYEAVLALNDSLLQDNNASFLSRWLGRVVRGVPAIGMMNRYAMRLAQRHKEKKHAAIRRELLRQDQQLAEVMSFSRRKE